MITTTRSPPLLRLSNVQMQSNGLRTTDNRLQKRSLKIVTYKHSPNESNMPKNKPE